MAFAEADILGTLGADVAALLGAVGPLEVLLPATEPGAVEAGLGNVAGGLGACAARGTVLFCAAPAVAVDPGTERSIVLVGRGRTRGMVAEFLGDGDMVAFGGSFLGAVVVVLGAMDCRFAAVEADAPGALVVLVGGTLEVERVAPGGLVPGARDCRGLERDCDNDCL